VRVIVVTGTNTGVGKTVVTAALAACAQAFGLSVAVVKPVQTGVTGGDASDLDEVARLSGVTDLHEYARFDEPLAPGTAARRLGIPGPAADDFARRIASLADRDLVLVEGAGGLLVELDATGKTLVDLAVALARTASVEVVLVASAGLGVLSIAALTARALISANMPLDAVIVGAWPAEPDLAARCNLTDLPRYAGAALAGVIPDGSGNLDRHRFAAVAAASLAPRFHGTFDPPAFAHGLSAPISRGASPMPPADPATDSTSMSGTDVPSVLARARNQVLIGGTPLAQHDILDVLRLPDEHLDELLELAHQVRMRWCGPEIEVEGIISLKTGGCPEDCHFCSQSGQFSSPVRAVWLDVPSLVEAAKQTAKTGATEFCIVAAVRGPDERLMKQVADGVRAIRAEVEINIACSLGMLTQAQVDELTALGVHRYNHNLETARSYFDRVVTTHTWQERRDTLRMVADAGIQVCCGGIIGMGETVEQRAEFAAQLAELAPDEVPMNFLNPRPGTPFGDLPVLDGRDALRTVAAFRLAMPRTVLRFAGGRELTLGDLGARQGMLGGINAVIVGNYLTTLGRPANADIALLHELKMPIKALSTTL
jgi:biotin synthase